MMNTFGSSRQNSTIEEIAEALKKKNSCVILVPEKPTQDAIAAAISLYFSLLKLGKDAYLVSSSKIDYPLAGVEKFQTTLNIKGDSLKISFPYQEGSVDKVDWGIDGETFYITIKPVEGYPKLDPSQVKFSYTGGTADCFVILDSPTLSSLGSVYAENKEAFQGVEIINIDRHFTNTRYGSLNYINTAASSLSEIVYSVIKSLGVEIDSDIATSLYAGLLSATNNFTAYNVKPETLEIAAELLRKGAKKPVIKKQVQTIPTSQKPTSNFISPKPTFEPKSTETNSQPPSAPQDWLKPKIFTSKKI